MTSRHTLIRKETSSQKDTLSRTWLTIKWDILNDNYLKIGFITFKQWANCLILYFTPIRSVYSSDKLIVHALFYFYSSVTASVCPGSLVITCNVHTHILTLMFWVNTFKQLCMFTFCEELYYVWSWLVSYDGAYNVFGTD